MAKFLNLRVYVVGIAMAALFLLGAANANAQNAAFLRIPGMDGSSKDPAHMNWMAVRSVVAGDLNRDAQADREASEPSVSELHASAPNQPGIAVKKQGSPGTASRATGPGMPVQPTTSRDAASGIASGKRMHKPLVIVREVDAASPKLMEACASGKHIPTAAFDVVSGGRTTHYTLTDVVITSDQKSSGGDRPTETVTLNFTKITMNR